MLWLHLLQMCIVNRCRLRLTTVLVVLPVVVMVAPHMGHPPHLHLIGPMLETLHSDLQKFFISQLEEVVHPLMDEASTIKLWLAWIANHLENRRATMQGPLCSRFGRSIWPLFPSSAFFDSNTLVFLHAYPGIHISW